jgi:hypothetical protein
MVDSRDTEIRGPEPGDLLHRVGDSEASPPDLVEQFPQFFSRHGASTIRPRRAASSLLTEPHRPEKRASPQFTVDRDPRTVLENCASGDAERRHD